MKANLEKPDLTRFSSFWLHSLAYFHSLMVTWLANQVRTSLLTSSDDPALDSHWALQSVPETFQLRLSLLILSEKPALDSCRVFQNLIVTSMPLKAAS
jgi:hypothetical protein